MPPTPKVTMENVMEAALAIVRERGIHDVNARSVAGSLGCSTRPLFRLYENMEALKADLYRRFDKIYENFMEKRIDPDHRLLTQSLAFVHFARAERRIFQAMFLSQTLDGVSLSDLKKAPWNQATIQSVMSEHLVDRTAAEGIYIDLWLYATGLAVQVSANDMSITDDEITALVTGLHQSVIRAKGIRQ